MMMMMLHMKHPSLVTPLLRRSVVPLASLSTTNAPSSSSSFSSSRYKSTTAAAAVEDEQHPNNTPNVPLVEIPKLPLLGSMVPAYSKIPKMDPNKMTDYFRKLNQTYGPYYSFGMPGLGGGDIYNTIYVVRDPAEMMKVLKQEGTYPSGGVEDVWPLHAWMKSRPDFQASGLFKSGEEWKRLRHFMQKDLFSPASAKEYLSVVIEGARLGSSKAPEMQHDLHSYLNFCALDMFAGIIFGGVKPLGDDYTDFCKAGVSMLNQLQPLTRSPYEGFMYKMGFTTQLLQTFIDTNNEVHEIAGRRLREFRKHLESDDNGDITEGERQSYFAKMLARQPGSDVSDQEVMELCTMVLSAAVDTTAAKTSWNLLHLALRQDLQEELREQVQAAVDRHGKGTLVPEIISNNEVPLLQAVVRETHRVSPVIFGDLSKVISKDTQVYGRTLPEGSKIMFDSLTNMMDPELVDDPMTFNPKRWYKDAVDARKGTKQAIIDHPFYSGPFSQGARRCPGSRVANLEIQAFLSQALLDWKIEGPADTHWSDVDSEVRLMTVPIFPSEVRFVPRS